MARLASEAKSLFYPLNPAVPPLIRQHLQYPQEPWSAVDLCAGEGLAFNDIVLGPDRGIGDSGAYRYCVELDSGRAEKCRELMPDANVLGPCDGLTARISSGTFGLGYINPPFSHDAWSPGRLETRFLNRAYGILKSQGVLVAVVPSHQLVPQYYYSRQPEFAAVLRSCFRNLRIVRLPEDLAQYGECVVLGIARSQPLGSEQPGEPIEFCDWKDIGVYEIPESGRPKLFEKVGLTDSELQAEFERSPLNRLFDSPPIRELGRPLLPLSKGHTATILVAGVCDGAVNGPSGLHVVRGVAKKEEYEKSKDRTDDGETVTTKTVRSERTKTIVRAVYQDGRIVNYE